MDRQVHATRTGIGEVVRYNRAGRWYWEPYGCKRSELTLKEAVEKSLWCGEAGNIHFAKPGGSRFDSSVKKAMATEL